MIELPATASFAPGVEVPIPKLPPNSDVVPTTENAVSGLDVPIPILPFSFSKRLLLVMLPVPLNLERKPDTPAPEIEEPAAQVPTTLVPDKHKADPDCVVRLLNVNVLLVVTELKVAKPLCVLVPLTWRLPVVVRFPLTMAAPATSSLALGEDVPTPKLPLTANPLAGPVTELAKPRTELPTALRFAPKIVLPLIVPVP